MRQTSYKPLVSATMATGLVFGCASAMAESFAIEEVVVTAQKRAQSINDIGVTASAFSGNDLKNLKTESAVELAGQTPGLSTANATSGGTPIFAIRGIGLDDFNINNNSGVGVYIDEVFASSPMLLSGQLFDIERVEVLKGPQGTLYGKNATGGAVNFISNKPSDEFEAYITAGIARWDTAELEGVISGSLTDSINGRFATSYRRQSEGWQTDVDSGKHYGEVDSLAARAVFTIDFSDSVDGVLNLHYSRDKSLPLAPQSTGSEEGAQALTDALCPGFDIPGVLDYCGLPVEGALDTDAGDKPDANDVRVGNLKLDRDEEGYGLAFTLNAELEHFSLISITAYDHYERSVVDNYDGVPGGNFDLIQDGDVEQFSQELRLVSSGTEGFTWIAGIGYSRDKLNADDAFDSSQTLWWNIFPTSPLDTGLVVLDSQYQQVTDSYGAYLHTETDLTDRLSLTVGARYSYDERSFDGNAFNTGTDTGLIPLNIASLDETQDEDDVSYRVGLNFAANEDWLIYASIATGYKNGVYYGSPPLAQAAWGYNKPEEVETIEIGFKSTLLDGTMQLNGALFESEYENRQSLAFVTVPGIGFDTTLGNIPESEIAGAEMDLFWRPMEGLDVKAGVSYLNSKVTETLTDIRGLAPYEIIAEGSELGQAPEWSYNALVGYEWGVNDKLTARLQFDYSWTDVQVAALSDPNTQYGPLKSLGTSFSLKTTDDTWEFTVWGKNVTDEDDSTYSFTNFAGGRVMYRQQPASYGISLTRHFF